MAANRGASGIDGVLSTAAGFADGLGRGTTLLVGDLSFLHDINGLNLLRSGERGRQRCALRTGLTHDPTQMSAAARFTPWVLMLQRTHNPIPCPCLNCCLLVLPQFAPPGEMRPPLTVVLVNNGGGGIFSFLPIADAMPEDVFTPLWATPQHVDLAGVCESA